MRKIYLFSLLTTLFLTGCSQDEPSPDNGGGSGEPQFLRINLVTNSTNQSRAAGDQTTGDPNAEGLYEEGLEAENKVEKIRFYFFKADGSAASVQNMSGTKVNYLDWTVVSDEGTDMPNIEKILGATLIFQSPQKDDEPELLVAIVNPSVESANTSQSLTTLGEIARDYKTYTTAGKFVMSNSTHMHLGETQTKEMAVSVVGKIHKTVGEALNDPIDIYVERTVAKVRLKSSLTPLEGTTNIFKTSTDGSQKITVDGTEKEIFVKFLGWNTTAVADKSRLAKEINPAWKNIFTGSQPWNWAEYHRCFWAVNATSLSYQYGAFIPDSGSDAIEGNKFQAQAKNAFDGTQYVYVNENASDNFVTGDNATTPTKVIISAQLVDKEGNPLEFAEYGDQRIPVEKLKELFANNCHLWKKTVVNKETKFVKISPDELTIKTATEIGVADENTAGRYKVYVQLASSQDKMWYPSNNKDANFITAEEANEQLKNFGSAKVWKEGQTYYYFDIEHLGGKIGVVRNHIYEADIKSLKGLGTPVYNPEEIIYPEHPQDSDDKYIAAQIRILSWRVVKSEASLDW